LFIGIAEQLLVKCFGGIHLKLRNGVSIKRHVNLAPGGNDKAASRNPSLLFVSSSLAGSC